MTSRAADTPPRRRLPPWLKKTIPAGPASAAVRRMLRQHGLHAVCDEAQCPNRAECFARGAVAFMILGDVCTRSCRFCAVAEGQSEPPRPDEPEAVARAAAKLDLKHVVITSVTRDDLPDGGAAHFAATIRAVRACLPEATVEVLIPDFAGDTEAVKQVMAARPDLLNHNIETVQRLYPAARPQADYRQSLTVLAAARQLADGYARTKSGFMVGLGETDAEVLELMADLRAAGCEILTIGQYLSPSVAHLPVARFVEPAAFEAWRRGGQAMGFAAVAAGPFVRSSYRAQQVLGRARDRCAEIAIPAAATGPKRR